MLYQLGHSQCEVRVVGAAYILAESLLVLLGDLPLLASGPLQLQAGPKGRA